MISMPFLLINRCGRSTSALTGYSRTSMIILGLNAFHGDSAAALVRDGALVAAAEEERFRRVKHWAGFPSQAIAYCLREAGVALADVQHVAVNQDSRANLLRKLAYLVSQRPDLGLMLNRLKNRRARGSISELLAGELFRRAFSWRGAPDRASSRASFLGLPCFAV